MVTLYLIAANVYGTVEGPKDRGFSYIEIWMVGIQITILLAIFEYAIVLALIKRFKKNQLNRRPSHLNEDFIEKMDMCSMIGSAVFFLLAVDAVVVVFNIHIPPYKCFKYTLNLCWINKK